MDILFVVPYVPDLIRVRPYNLIRHLTMRGQRITVMTLYSSEAERQSAEALREHCSEVVALELPKWRSLANAAAARSRRVPMQADYCWLPILAEQIEAAIWPDKSAGRASFDIVHVEHLRGARYGHRIQSRFNQDGRTQLPIVWDSVDSITHLFRQSSASSKKILSRLLARFELALTEKHEAVLASIFDHMLVTSKKDRDAFLDLPGIRKDPQHIHVLPNGVDLDYFTPDNTTKREAKNLVISGKMSYHANVSMVLYFVNQILPLIRKRHPDVKVTIVGKDPPRGILALAQDPNIVVTGTVADIRPYLRRAVVAIAPLTYGAGIQNKILEAMACETPVVTTSRAISALEVQSGVELLTAAEEVDFANGVCRLLDDPALREQIGRNGRAYVERSHNWMKVAAQLEGIYEEACSNLLKQP